MLDRIVARLAGLVTHTEPPRVFTELGRHPRLFRSWLPFATMLLRGELPREDAELVILRTAWNCSCRYEWVQHAALAERSGLEPAAIEAVPDGAQAPVWSVRQRALLRATDELHAGRTIQAPTLANLRALLSERQLLELCALVGHYEMLAMILNTGDVEPEPSALARLSGRRADIADALILRPEGPPSQDAS